MLERSANVRKTLERCSKCLKDAARSRYQSTLSANVACRSMYDYIARLNQRQGRDDGEGGDDRPQGNSGGFFDLGESFMARLEKVIFPPACIEDDPNCKQQLAASQKLQQLSKAISVVVSDLAAHQKTAPSAAEILRVKESIGGGGNRDQWLCQCDYNVLLRQALHANRERR